MADEWDLVEKRTRDGKRVWVQPAPDRCRNGHLLAGNCDVRLALCACDKVKPRSRGHMSWTCRTPNCGDVIYADGHTDNTQLAAAERWAPNNQS